LRALLTPLRFVFAAQGYERAVKSGGDARLAGKAREDAARRAAAAAAQQQQKRAPPPAAAVQAQQRAAAAAAATREARHEAAQREYEQALGKLNRERLEAAAAWRASTGTDMQRPPVDRGTRCAFEQGRLVPCTATPALHAPLFFCSAHAPSVTRSIHVDLFGTLRGACKRAACAMWRRDVATAKNWSDTTVLTCQVRPSRTLRAAMHA